MGSYNWRYKSLIIIVTLRITPRLTTHEPPSGPKTRKQALKPESMRNANA